MSEFFSYSRAIVENFLQTAVLLDDRAFMEKNKEDVPKELVKPKAKGIEKNENEKKDQQENSVEDQPISKENQKDDNAHNLDANVIIDTFMEKGILCSVLKCDEASFNSKIDKYISLMKKADIIILDWSLFGDFGDKIISVIQQLIEKDEMLQELRTILIYTANDIENVKKKLSEIQITFNEGSNICNNQQYTAVSLYSKPNSHGVNPENKVEFSDLINKCIDDFTQNICGIIPNVTLAALTELRNNTHKLLGVLNKNLDIAYLSHRALLPVSEEAEKHVEEMVIGELQSIVHCHNIGKNASLDIIKSTPYIASKNYMDIPFINYLDSENVKDNKTLTRDIKDCFSYQWYNEDEVKTRKSEIDFAVLTTIQTEYIKKNRQLTLGVIIKEMSSNRILLCLQPRCDSVRLTGEVDFIFLTLEKSTSDKFHLIINDEKYINRYNKGRTSIIFKPCSIKQFVINDEEYLYEDIEGKKYQYIATLKKLKAQKIIDEYTSHLSRVGLNESEYLRRSGLF